MKKFTLLLVMLMTSIMFSQVSIGSGSSTGQAIPVEPFYGFTYSQSIYLQAEIGGAGDITTLTWDFAGATISNSNDWTIYIGHTTKTDFTSTTDWVDVATLTQVYSGIVTLTGNQVVVDITDFTYNNSDNLIIAVDENAAGFNGSSDDFNCFLTGTSRSITYRSDGTNPDPTAPPATASSTPAAVPNIILGGLTSSIVAPNCAENLVPTDAATNVTITGGNITLSWDAPSVGDAPSSYNVWWGTTSGALSDIGATSATTVDITNVDFSTTYYWSVVPSNAGGSATGCAEMSFTTQAAPVGALCTNAIVVGSLPYNTTDDTANYSDDYSGTPGDAASCGSSSSYLNGDDVVYEYTAAADGSINIAMTAIGSTWSGIFVYTDCADIGTTCANGVANSGSTDRIFDLAVTNGTTYYIVISTFASPQSTTYTLDITENTCTNATATYSIVNDCANSGGFFIDVDVTDLGSATSLTASDGTTTMPVTATGVVQFGPYTNATDVTITVTNDQDNSCVITSSVLTQAACPPANDTLAGAIPIVPSASGTGCASFTFTDSAAADGTTDSGLDGSCNNTSTGLDRFYSWTATSDALIWNDGDGNPGIVIRTTAGVEITCEATFAGTAVLSGWTIGDDLIIQVYDFGTADVATSFCLEEYTIPAPPANDDCANATQISSVPFNLTEDASGATNNGGFTSCDGSALMNDGVWYTFIPSVDGTIDIAITNVGPWDPRLGIFSGSCGAFTCVANSDGGGSGGDETLSALAVTAGTQYWVNVANWSSSTDNAEGAFDISITGVTLQVLSVEDNIIDGFSMYPNPVNDVLRFTALDNIETISIYNLLGQEVMRAQPNASNTQIDMSDLTTGMYVVKVQVGNQLGTYRVMKK